MEKRPVNISVETVVQRNQLKLNELRRDASLFKVEMLEARDVGLVLRECDFPDINQACVAVVIKHLRGRTRDLTSRL